MDNAKHSYGFVEVRHYVESMILLDQMLKSNHVELVSMERLGSGYLTIVIKGDLASVEWAIEEAASHSFSGDVSVKIIAKPYPGWERLLTNGNQEETKGDEDDG